MNWLKTKMGSHGWDINDDDIKKPNVLFLVPVKFARQELEDFEEYFTVKVTKRPFPSGIGLLFKWWRFDPSVSPIIGICQHQQFVITRPSRSLFAFLLDVRFMTATVRSSFAGARRANTTDMPPFSGQEAIVL